jgi:RHS repeat-associated protein
MVLGRNGGYIGSRLRLKRVALLVVSFYCFTLFPFHGAVAKTTPVSPERLGGNFRYQSVDISIPSPGFPLSVTRTYNSQSHMQGLFGYGWHTEFDVSVVPSSDGRLIYVIESDGSVRTFTYNKENKSYYSKHAGWHTVKKRADGSYLWQMPGGRFHEFDSRGRLTTSYDLKGNRLILTYSDKGRLTKVTTATGQSLMFQYDTAGRVQKVLDPLGRINSYHIDPRGNLIQVMDAMGRSTLYWYDQSHNLVEICFPDGSTKSLTYDTERDLLLEEAGPGASRTIYRYDVEKRTVRITDGNGETTTLRYNVDFTQKVITDPSGGKTTLQYEDGLLVLLRDPSGSETRYTYDDRGNLIAVENGLGYRASIEHHRVWNLPIAITDTLGRRYVFEYDKKSNLIKATDPLGASETYVYTPDGRLKDYMNPLGHTQHYEYDQKGYLTRIVDATGPMFEAVYDDAGQLVKRTYPDGTSISFEYNPSGQIIDVTDSGNRSVRFLYNTMDRVVAHIDPEGNRTNLSYDAKGLLTATRDPLGNEVHYDYDGVTNLIKLTDGNGNMTRFVRDSLGRLTERVDAGGNRFRYDYDPSQRSSAVTDAMGKTIRYQYDAAGQLIKKVYPDGGSIFFTYNPAGLLTAVRGSNASYSFTYDELNRLVAKHDTNVGQTVRYSYDAAGQVVKKVGPAGKVFRYGYNRRGNLTTIIDPLGAKTNYTYDAADRRRLITYPNQARARFSYDVLGRVSRIRHETNDGKPFIDLQYAYDRRDNRVSVKLNGVLRRYAYDALSQLVKETREDGQTISYAYDALGNRLEARGAVRERYTYDALNRLTKTAQDTYRYDANGNLTKRISRQETAAYKYDMDGILTQVRLPQGTYRYAYDAFGSRIARSGADEEERYLHDREDVLADFSGDGALKRLYIHGPGIDDVAGLIEGNASFAVHADALGSVLALTDSEQHVVSRYDYTAFGEVKPVKERIAMPFLFTGARHDRETGFHYLRSRAYDPQIGRFISPDVIGIAGGINLYRYVGNNPVNLTDPSGEAIFVSALLVVAAVTAVGAGIGALGAKLRGGSALAGAKGGAASAFIFTGAVTLAAIGGAPALGLALVGAVAGGVGSMIGSIVEQYNTGKGIINPTEVLWSSVFGTLFGGFGGAWMTSPALESMRQAGIITADIFAKEVTKIGFKSAVITLVTELLDEGLAMTRDSSPKKFLEKKKQERVKDLQAILSEAQALKAKQDAAIGEAEKEAANAQGAAAKVKGSVPMDRAEAANLCSDCRAKISQLKGIGPGIESYNPPLIGNRDIAREKARVVCNDPTRKDAKGIVDSIDDAAHLATNQAKQIAILAKRSRSLESEVRACVAKIEALNKTITNTKAALQGLADLEQKVKTHADNARKAATRASKCKLEGETLRKRFKAKVDEIIYVGQNPKKAPFAAVITQIEATLGKISADANKADPSAARAESIAKSVTKKIAGLKPKLKGLKPCLVKPPKAGLADDHEATAITAAMFASDTRAEAQRARQCLTSPPKKKGPSTGAATKFDRRKPYTLKAVFMKPKKVTCKTSDGRTVTADVVNVSELQVVVEQDGKQYDLYGNEALQLLVAAGLVRKGVCGWVTTETFDAFGPAVSQSGDDKKGGQSDATPTADDLAGTYQWFNGLQVVVSKGGSLKAVDPHTKAVVNSGSWAKSPDPKYQWRFTWGTGGWKDDLNLGVLGLSGVNNAGNGVSGMKISDDVR